MSIKHPCVRLLAMESREEKQRNIEQRMDAYFNDIRELFFVLGQKLFDLDSKLPLPVGKNFFEQCLGVQMRKNEADEKYKTQSKLLWDYSEKSDELERHKLSCDEIDVVERRLKIRLGAIIYERASQGILEKEKFLSAYSDISKEIDLKKKLESRNPIERLASQSALQRFDRNANERYVQYSNDAIENNSLDLIGGNNAPSLIEELESVIGKKRAMEEAKRTLQDYIDSNQQEAERLKKGGLDKSEQDKRDLENLYHESFINYGNYLFDKGALWVDQDTPSDVLDVIEEILALQKEYADLSESREKLDKASKADDYRFLIENEQNKILILEKEKEKIDQEIAKVREEIKRLESMIDRL